jgi:polyhydroxybutyrate depolymerase
MTRTRWVPVALLMVVMAGCTSTPDEAEVGETPPVAPTTVAAEPAAPAAPGETVTVELDDRPFRLYVPESYDPAERHPLVVLLHGYTSSGAEAALYFNLTAESDRRGFLYAMPDGTVDADGERFWNATETCCDFRDTGVDDAGYLRRLIDAVVDSYPVDTARVYLLGHSNGGFMAYRMACDHASVIAAVVSLAGAATSDASQCAPERPVGVLQIHGTADTTIPYDGGAIFGNPFPSAAATVEMWRRHNGCGDQAGSAPSLDLDSRVPGPETTVTTYAAGCRDGTRVELWSIADGSHVPPPTADFTPTIMDFLYEFTAPA